MKIKENKINSFDKLLNENEVVDYNNTYHNILPDNIIDMECDYNGIHFPSKVIESIKKSSIRIDEICDIIKTEISKYIDMEKDEYIKNKLEEFKNNTIPLIVEDVENELNVGSNKFLTEEEFQYKEHPLEIMHKMNNSRTELERMDIHSIDKINCLHSHFKVWDMDKVNKLDMFKDIARGVSTPYMIEGVNTMNIIPKRVYRHFKGKFYYVLDIVKHTETAEDYVIYQALYDNNDKYCRPLSMFSETIDINREDNITKQKFRFKLFEGDYNETK